MASRPALAPLLAILFGILGVAGCRGPEPVARAGRILAPDGTPLPGVTVRARDGAAVTDPEGNWSLATQASELEFRKPGYKPTTRPAGERLLRLESTGRPVEVAWDERWNSPPTQGLRGWLAGQGVALKPVMKGQPLPPAEVVVLAAPAYSSYEALAELRAAAHGGATLLLAGEWGGYPAVDLAALNDLAAPAGIRFEGSLVRDAAASHPDRLTPTFEVPVAGSGESASFAGSGALSAVPPARILGVSATSSYRVTSWSQGPQILAAYGPLGGGKVVAIADSSWLTDHKAPESDRPNWLLGGNAALALTLIRF